MKKFLFVYLLICSLAFGQEKIQENQKLIFQDIPKNHWAYKAVENLVDEGVIAQNEYLFRGNSPVTRYEFAYDLSKALNKVQMEKANRGDLVILESLVYEFSQELNKIGFDAETFNGKIENIQNDIGLLKKGISENQSTLKELEARIKKLEKKVGD